MLQQLSRHTRLNHGWVTRQLWQDSGSDQSLTRTIRTIRTTTNEDEGTRKRIRLGKEYQVGLTARKPQPGSGNTTQAMAVCGCLWIWMERNWGLAGLRLHSVAEWQSICSSQGSKPHCLHHCLLFSFGYMAGSEEIPLVLLYVRIHVL